MDKVILCMVFDPRKGLEWSYAGDEMSDSLAIKIEMWSADTDS